MARKKDQRERVPVPVAWFKDEVTYGAKLLGLTDWDITVTVKPSVTANGEKVEALCEPHDGHLTCRISFRQDVLNGEARYNVYHELGHLMFRSWNRADGKIIDDMVPDLLNDQATDALTRGEEDAMERFAHAIVRLLPAERKEPDGLDA